jgi:carboxyl-terminal processing protease
MSRKTSLVVLSVSLVFAVLLMASAAWPRQAPVNHDPARQLGIMAEVYAHINDDYVTTPNLPKVSEGALHGLLTSLDADSSYLDRQQYKNYLAEQADPPAGGIQAVIAKRFGYADVVDVRPGGAAAKAGLVRGDFVEAIGSAGTHDLSTEAIERRLHGAPGTTVTLHVVHMHHSNPVPVTITLVAHTMAPLAVSRHGSVGVIAVPNFDHGRTAQIAAAVKTLRRQGAKALILDLRDCGGGSFREAENTADLFLSHGTIAYFEGQTVARVTRTANPAKTIDAHGRLVVLVNFGTFGPAEVAAAALQQNGRAQLVGDATFGEASIQKIIPVGDGSALWLTVARYYTPKGKAVQDGITPSVAQVRYEGALPDLDYRPEGVTGPLPDLQMQKAMALAMAPVPAQAAGATK